MDRDLKTAQKAQKYELIEQWKKSDKSTVDFCKEHNLLKSSLYYWHKQLKKEEQLRRKEKSRNKFIPVKITKEKEQLNQLIEIIYPNGVKVVLTEKTDKQTIQTLISLY